MVVPPLRFDIVDVFTDRPFAGNQLAVVQGAAALSTAQCLAVAREFGFSETTFPVPVSSSSYFTRIFTPGGEIPFAGHPTLGTAWVLRAQGVLSANRVTQACGMGDVEVELTDDGLVELSAPARDLVGPLPADVTDALLADIGLHPADLDGQAYVAGTGLDFVYLPVRPGAVARARVPARPLDAHDALTVLSLQDPIGGVSVHSVTGSADDVLVHARVFVPGLAVPEDPATGSAAAGLGVVLAGTGRLSDDGRLTIRQGAELGRPSTLFGRLERSDGRLVAVHVSGGVHRVASGEIDVPPAGS
jgi:trans-2,3-dihydro-3-hydroxyanthranilate isomerase